MYGKMIWFGMCVGMCVARGVEQHAAQVLAGSHGAGILYPSGRVDK